MRIMSYRIRRSDRNQSKIVEKFRSLGAHVFITSEIGRGFPDLVVSIPLATNFGLERRMFLIEIKDGEQIPSKQKLSPKEQEFFNDWYEHVRIVRSEQEVVDLIESLR